ncbi:hypothetical protein RJ639_037714 [Escallonia herrerae]|uniref:Uncharacterized protein n=1 Tax=Escallonia herrerae TaxID=1293975 RepID=A0AA89B5G9_9ASTE|nr:hypothetical protein RJ639_037714 [Escallonia herrerae]
MEISLSDMLFKVALFGLVQALVYVILSKSSNLFSNTSPLRSMSFKTARSVSIRRIMAALSDLPAAGEPSPSSAKDLRSPRPARQDSISHEQQSS